MIKFGIVLLFFTLGTNDYFFKVTTIMRENSEQIGDVFYFFNNQEIENYV